MTTRLASSLSPCPGVDGGLSAPRTPRGYFPREDRVLRRTAVALRTGFSGISRAGGGPTTPGGTGGFGPCARLRFGGLGGVFRAAALAATDFFASGEDLAAFFAAVGVGGVLGMNVLHV